MTRRRQCTKRNSRPDLCRKVPRFSARCSSRNSSIDSATALACSAAQAVPHSAGPARHRPAIAARDAFACLHGLQNDPDATCIFEHVCGWQEIRGCRTRRQPGIDEALQLAPGKHVHQVQAPPSLHCAQAHAPREALCVQDAAVHAKPCCSADSPLQAGECRAFASGFPVPPQQQHGEDAL